MTREFQLPHLGGNLISTQISAVLMRELKTGSFAAAERLPAEVDLAATLGVSRTVIRDALSDLEREGFIERVRGIGTVINRSIVQLQSRLDLKLEYNDLIIEAGCRATTDNVKVYTQNADTRICNLLDIDEGESVIVCEKRIMADFKPVIFSIDYIPSALLNGKAAEDFNWNGPVFDILDKESGARVTSNITKVRAVIGDEGVRQMLKLPDGEALLLMEEVSYTKLCRPVMTSHTYYTSFFDFSVLRKKF